MATLDKKQMMKRIVDAVGRDAAIQMVMQAYNTELITTWLSRLEVGKPNLVGTAKRRDHLYDALSRVLETCELAG